MKAKEIRELSSDELVVEMKNLQEALFRLRFRQVTENTHNQNEIRALRRDIARVRTIVREREMAGQRDKA
jgi:large subunit ribosomal protein L29